MIPELITFLMLALACFRLSELITVDDGPADVFLKWRLRMGSYDIGTNGEPQTSLGKLFSCPYCTGIYVAFVLTVLANYLSPLGSIWNFLIYWLALAGAQAFLQTIGGRR